MPRVSVAATMVDAFYREVLDAGEVWMVRDDAGYPAPLGRDGVRRMPFWSTRGRAQRVIDQVPAYGGMWPAAVSYEHWRTKWLAELDKDGLLVGLNWSGKAAVGYDLSVQDLLRNFEARSALHRSAEQPDSGGIWPPSTTESG
jgi:hypothetical protein